ncbi:MAG TPA: hypothetical protein VLA34_13585 [Candidatus Krumholzibacterium sp.]|nr:hypothetical protein [Candidatus Krumholzibacterium sp.]
MIVDEIIKAAQTKPALVTAWGDVLGVSPTLVRFAGDTADTQIDNWLTSYTPTTNDRVILLKVGSTWVILGDIA